MAYDTAGVNAVGDDDAGGCNRREGGNGSGVDNDMDCPDGDFNKSIQEDDRGYDCKMVCLAGCLNSGNNNRQFVAKSPPLSLFLHCHRYSLGESQRLSRHRFVLLTLG